MGIYIKGDFDLPQNGGYKEIHIFDNGRVWWLFKDGGRFEGKWIPVPDHGDLIDRDALNATDSWEWIRHQAPVVIPAERNEE